MKKTRFLSIILAALVTGFIITSCEKDDEIQIPEIAFENATYSISETSTSALAVTITSDIPAPQDITINFNVTGTAVSGVNYVAFTSTSITVDEGDTEATILINPINVPVIEANKTIILTLAAANDYDLAGTDIVTTITIEDNNVAPNDAPVVQFTSGDVIKNAYLEDTVTVTLGLDVAFNEAMLIPLELTGDAVKDTDFEILDLTANNEIEFAAGEVAAEFRVVTKYNNVADLDVDLDIGFAAPTTTAYIIASTNTEVNINMIDPTADYSAWFNVDNEYNYFMAGGSSLAYRTDMPAYDIKRYYWDILDNGGDYNILSSDHYFYPSDTEHNTWVEVINTYQKLVGWPSVDITEQERYEIQAGDFLGFTKYFANEATYLKTLMKSVDGWLRFVVTDPTTPGEGLVFIPEQTIKLYKIKAGVEWKEKTTVEHNGSNESYYFWYSDANNTLGDLSASTNVEAVDIVIHGAEGTFSNSSSEIIFDIMFTVADVDLDMDEKYHMEKDGDTYKMRIKYINAK